jgi:hypothetical protein
MVSRKGALASMWEKSFARSSSAHKTLLLWSEQHIIIVKLNGGAASGIEII